MGFLKATLRALITGRDRGRYMDFGPYDRSGYLWPGELSDRTFSQYRNSGHIFDANAYGNVMDTGHFYSRHRIWGNRSKQWDHSFAPRLSWKFIVNILSSSPDPKTFQWEMRKQKELLIQSVSWASPSEISGLVKCHLRQSEKIASKELAVAIQRRIDSFHSETLQESVKYLESMHQYGFRVPNVNLEQNSSFSKSLTRIKRKLEHKRRSIHENLLLD